MFLAASNAVFETGYEEWMMAAAQKRLDAKEERLFQAFRQFDLDGDGHITADEMKKGNPVMSTIWDCLLIRSI